MAILLCFHSLRIFIDLGQVSRRDTDVSVTNRSFVSTASSYFDDDIPLTKGIILQSDGKQEDVKTEFGKKRGSGASDGTNSKFGAPE